MHRIALTKGLKLWIYWESIDRKTKARAEMRVDMQKKTRIVTSIKSFIEENHLDNQSTEMHSKAKKGDPMDIGALANQGRSEDGQRYSASEWADYMRQLE